MSSIGGFNHRPEKNNLGSNGEMNSEQAANYIWTDLLGELQKAYNDQILEIQNKNSSDPQKMQRLIKELGETYQEKVAQISDSYNDVRKPGATADDIKNAIQNAKNAISELKGVEPTPENPEAAQANKIDQKANDIVQDCKLEINEMIKKLQQLGADIKSKEALLSSLEDKIAEMKKTDPSKAKDLEAKLKDVKATLNDLKSQSASFNTHIQALTDLKSQLEAKANEIESLYALVLKGENIGQNTQKLQEMLESIQGIEKSMQSALATYGNVLDQAVGSIDNINKGVKSIETALTPNVNPNPGSGPVNWDAKGQEAYIDITLLPFWSLTDYSMWQDYPQGIIPASKIEAYLNSLFSQMKEAGVNQIDIAFAQFSSIDDLLEMAKGGNVEGSNDLLVQIMRDHKVLNEDGSITNALSKFIEMAHQNGMKIDLSIGGENTAAAKICKEGETPAGQAAKLAELMNLLGIDKVDFDLENTAIIEQNTTQELREYFSKVHDLLKADGKESILTTMGSIADWVGNDSHPGQGFFHDIFYDDNGNSIFNEMFDGLNLMLYGQETSYLDVSGDRGWGIDDWLDIIGKDNASKIHIGFEDAVNYADSTSNQGDHPFEIREGSSSGEAAAQIFHQIKEALAEKGYSSDLGSPFWWPQYDADHQKRYQLNPDGGVDFMYDVEVDFWKELNKLEGKS